MIQFKKIEDVSFIQNYFPDMDATLHEQFVFAIENDTSVLGAIQFLIKEDICSLNTLFLKSPTDMVIAEGLLRAALFLASNHNAYIAKCSNEAYKDLLLSLSFTKQGNVFIGEIPTVLTCSSCSKNHSCGTGSLLDR